MTAVAPESVVQFAPESTVVLRPYVQRREGQETIIGDPDRRVYLAVPAEGMEIIEDLATGKTVAESARRYEEKHQQAPDIDAFLGVLAAEGFLGEQNDPPPAVTGDAPARRPGLSLNWISPRVAAFLSGGPMLLVYLAIILLGGGLFVSDPGVLPGPNALRFYGGDYALLLVITVALAVVGTLLHELGHAVAARATGIPVTLGMGNLLYVMVAQTNITGIQLASKRRRYLAVVAGTIVDLVSASLLFAVIYADHRGVIALPPLVARVLDAVLFTYLLRSFAQMFFYVRTDFYYLIATAFNCRNLLVDTETLLKNVVRRLAGRRHRVVNQSHIPRRERAVIRGYAVIYIVGRVFAFAALFFFIIPLLGYVFYQFAQYLAGNPAAMGFIDFVAIGTLVLLTYGGGIVLWGRSLHQGNLRRRARRAMSRRAEPSA
jgi:putative peptide zinc metalloprotease protein